MCQGMSGRLNVQGCLFRNRGSHGAIPASQRTRAIMVDDGGGDFWNIADGRGGAGFAHGHITIRGNGFDVGPGAENLSPVIRVGNLGSGAHKICRSLRIEGNAIYGERLQLQMSNIHTGKTIVTGNNTEAIHDLAQAFGLDVAHEALIPLQHHTIPVSQGLVR